LISNQPRRRKLSLILFSLDNFACAQGQYNKDGRAHMVVTEGKVQRCGQRDFRGVGTQARVHRPQRAASLRCRDFAYSAGEGSLFVSFAQRTANDGERGNQFLREFRNNEKTIPTILTTSQKLSTGVDALNIRNIVLMRPINSIIEFKQIIGRGTRLYEGKDYFTIYDFVKAYRH